jgi:hypothetical protein
MVKQHKIRQDATGSPVAILKRVDSQVFKDEICGKYQWVLEGFGY